MIKLFAADPANWKYWLWLQEFFFSFISLQFFERFLLTCMRATIEMCGFLNHKVLVIRSFTSFTCSFYECYFWTTTAKIVFWRYQFLWMGGLAENQTSNSVVFLIIGLCKTNSQKVLAEGRFYCGLWKILNKLSNSMLNLAFNLKIFSFMGPYNSLREGLFLVYM